MEKAVAPQRCDDLDRGTGLVVDNLGHRSHARIDLNGTKAYTVVLVQDGGFIYRLAPA